MVFKKYSDSACATLHADAVTFTASAKSLSACTSGTFAKLPMFNATSPASVVASTTCNKTHYTMSMYMGSSCTVTATSNMILTKAGFKSFWAGSCTQFVGDTAYNKAVLSTDFVKPTCAFGGSGTTSGAAAIAASGLPLLLVVISMMMA